MKGDEQIGGVNYHSALFRAPMLVVGPEYKAHETEIKDVPRHTVWTIWGNTIVENIIDDETLNDYLDTRYNNNLPAAVSDSKPFTMPNGEMFTSKKDVLKCLKRKQRKGN